MRLVDVHAMYPVHRSLSAKVRVFIDALVTRLSGLTSSPATAHHRFPSHTGWYASREGPFPPVSGKLIAVAGNDPAVEFGAVLGRAGLRFEVDMDHAEALRITQ